MRKYQLGSKHPTKHLYRIVALRNFGSVREGDIGGWVESERNVSQEGLCWVSGEACVSQAAHVSGDANVMNWARVYGMAVVTGSAVIKDRACVQGDACVTGLSIVQDDAFVCGDAVVIDRVVSGRDSLT